MHKNILFIVADDQRFNTINAMGNSEINTPNMDRLVNMGASFTNAHIPSGTSGAICMPSRAMIHTGRSLFHITEEGQQISKEHTIIGETLKKAGYYSCGIGKWHNGTSSFARSFNDGGSIFFGGMWDHWHVPISDYDKTGEYNNKKPYTPNFQKSNKTIDVHCDKITSGIHSTELFTNEALEKLKNRPKDMPFFTYVSYLAPHDPRTMPKEYKDMYKADNIKLPNNFMEEYPFNIGIENIRAESIAKYPRDEMEIKQHIADYYAMITHLDHNIGLLIDYLEDTNTLKDTIIIFTGDNGLAVGSHGYMAKQTHYEHSVRVPLIIAGGDIPNVEIDGYVYLMDIYKTICELIDIDTPKSVEGESLLPLINGKAKTIRKHLYFAFEDLIRSVKYKEYKLIKYKNAPNNTQLFNLKEDEDEVNNLYENPKYKDIIIEIEAIMKEYRNSWEDTNHKFTKSFWNDVV